jgi:small subunit ribosomal protein S8
MDPIANMLSSIKNAGERRYESVRIPFSKINFLIAKILEREGYLAGSSEISENGKKFIEIKLKYVNKKLIFNGMRRISKPGRRVYLKSRELRPVKGNLGIALISTSSGIMTNIEAKRRGLGGEVLLEVW